MRAAVMRQVGQPLTIEEAELDRPGPNEVLVDVVAAGLCHSDLRFLEGSFPHPLPTILGHEVSGIVTDTGSAVSEVSVGDHVVMSLSVFCGNCAHCEQGRSHLCTGKEGTRRTIDQPARISIGGLAVTQFLDLSGFAEKMLVHENAVVRIDDDIPLDHAALLGCGVATGLGAALNTAGVVDGDNVVVIGCGGVGLSAVQGARIAGAATVVAVDPLPARRDLALRLGATDVVDSEDPDLVTRVLDLTEGLGVDHVIEAVGRVDTIEAGFAMTRRGGTVTVVGLVPTGSKVTVPTDDLYYERRLQGSVMGSNDFKVDVPRYIQMYRDGRLDLGEMITERIRLEDINQGFESMISGRSPRVLVDFG